MGLTKAHNRMIAGAPVNVLDFGAIGDGVTDDTAAIQAALDSLSNPDLTHQSLYIPSGIYAITSALNIIVTGISQNRITVYGDGILNTIIRSSSTTDNAMTITGGAIEIKDLSVDSTAARTAGATGHGIFIDGGLSTTQSRVFLENVQSEGHPEDGVHAVKPELHRYISVWASYNGGHGIFMTAGGAGIGINNYLENCRSSLNSGFGIYLYEIINCTLINPQGLNNTLGQMWLRSGRGHVVINPDMEQGDGLTTGIDISGSKHQIIGGYFGELNEAITLTFATECIVSMPHLVGDATVAMTTGVSLDANCEDCQISVPVTANNVTSILSDSGARTQTNQKGLVNFAGITQDKQVISWASTITPDVSLGSLIQITLGGYTTIGVPTGYTLNQEIEFTFIQDGTGARPVAFNSVFKKTWADTGNAAGTRSVIKFRWNGSNWIQTAAQSPYV